MTVPSSDRRPWTQKQDNMLTVYVAQYIQTNNALPKWNKAAQVLKQKNYSHQIFNRTPKQCRQRWTNILKPGLKEKRSWDKQQSLKLLQLYQEKGHRWLKISNQLQGRSQNQVKNYFYSSVRRVIRKINIQIAKINSQTRKIMKNKKKEDEIMQDAKQSQSYNNVTLKSSQEIQRQQTQKALQQISMLNINKQDNQKKSNKSNKMQIQNEVQLFPLKNQVKTPLKLLATLNNDSINKVLLLAEQKQDCKLEIKREIQIENILQVRNQFINYIRVMFQKTFQNKQDSNQQSQQSESQNENDNSIFQNLTEFIESLISITKSCKKKKYRDFKLSAISKQQQQQILKDKKKNEHKMQKIIKQKLKEQGLNIIPNKIQRQQMIKKYSINSSLKNCQNKKNSNASVSSVLNAVSNSRFNNQISQNSNDFFDINIINNKIKARQNKKPSLKQSQSSINNQIFNIQNASNSNNHQNMSSIAQSSCMKKKGNQNFHKNNKTCKQLIKRSSNNKRKNSCKLSSEDQQFQVLPSHKKPIPLQKKKSISKQYRTRAKSIHNQTNQINQIQNINGMKLDMSASNPFLPFNQFFINQVTNRMDQSKNIKDFYKQQNNYFKESQKQQQPKLNGFLNCIPTYKVKNQTNNKSSEEVLKNSSNFRQIPSQSQLPHYGFNSYNLDSLGNSVLCSFSIPKILQQNFLNISSGSMNNQSNSSVNRSQGFRLIQPSKNDFQLKSGNFQSFKPANSNMINSKNEKRVFPEKMGICQLNNLQLNRSINFLNPLMNKMPSPRFQEESNFFNPQYNPLANLQLGQSHGNFSFDQYQNMEKNSKNSKNSKKNNSNSNGQKSQIDQKGQKNLLFDSQNINGLISSNNYQGNNCHLGLNLCDSIPFQFIQSANYQGYQNQFIKSLNQSMFLNQMNQNQGNDRQKLSQSFSFKNKHEQMKQK